MDDDPDGARTYLPLFLLIFFALSAALVATSSWSFAMDERSIVASLDGDSSRLAEVLLIPPFAYEFIKGRVANFAGYQRPEKYRAANAWLNGILLSSQNIEGFEALLRDKRPMMAQLPHYLRHLALLI